MFTKIKTYFFLIFITIALASCSKEQANTPADTGTLDNVPQQYIVVLKDNPTEQIQGTADYALIAKTILESHNISNDNTIEVYDNVIKGFAAKLTPIQFTELNNDIRISYIEKDQIINIDDYFENIETGSFTIQSQTTPWGITNVGGSVDATTNTGIAWIVDTGIDFTHPDLNVDTVLAKNFVSSGSTANDDHGHGTHVAGTIAAKNNEIGVVGVCAGATVVPIKVLDASGSGYVSQIISGINYVANNRISGKINVVNMSFAGSTSTSLDQAVCNLGSISNVYVCIAAANNASKAINYSPARVNGMRIFTISAYDNTGKFAYFSDYGNPPIDYSAPGVSIYSTYKGGTYATMSGTSMATPHVCGILLATGGYIHSSGTVKGDFDNIPDLKAHR